jgi:hypothetical protein
MALPSSGTITLSQIQTEFGGTDPISLSEYYRGGGLTTPNNTGVPTSGTISLSNFYGAARQFAFTISSAQTSANLRTLAVAAGWDQSAPVLATIGSDVYISSNSTGTPALTVNGSWPGGVQLINNGFIVGRGGNGGNGATSTPIPGIGQPELRAGTAGGAGGLALSAGVAVSISNNGTIGGGGGGGGGGGSTFGQTDGFVSPAAAGGPGGGGTGISSGGTTPSTEGWGGQSGTAPGGTLTAAGAGLSFSGGTGGTGGGYGSAGGNGTKNTLTADSIFFSVDGYSGGAAGAAVSGNANITWLAFGTRLGAIT